MTESIYQFNGSTDLSADAVLSMVNGFFWKKVLFFESVGSTNDVAAALAREEEAGRGLVVFADFQENGRGRLGRRWISPPGTNICMSIALRPEIPPRDIGLATILAAVSSAEALRRSSGASVSIKWPNDLTVEGKKIGGILTEVRSEPARGIIAVIGIGVNVNAVSMDFPEELRAVATSLRDSTGRSHPRAVIAAAVLNEFECWYEVLLRKGRAPLLDEWRKLSSTLGKRVSVLTVRESLLGIAQDIDEEGMLLLQLSSGEMRRVSAGDLTVLR